MSKKPFVLLMILALAGQQRSGSEGSEPEVAVDTAPPTATPTLPPPVLGSVDEQGNVGSRGSYRCEQCLIQLKAQWKEIRPNRCPWNRSARGPATTSGTEHNPMPLL